MSKRRRGERLRAFFPFFFSSSTKPSSLLDMVVLRLSRTGAATITTGHCYWLPTRVSYSWQEERWEEGSLFEERRRGRGRERGFFFSFFSFLSLISLSFLSSLSTTRLSSCRNKDLGTLVTPGESVEDLK